MSLLSLVRWNQKYPQESVVVVRPPLVSYWHVTTAAVAKVIRHEDIGDIREIDEMGRMVSVEELPGNRVSITARSGKRLYTYTLSDCFVTREKAQLYAYALLQKEIERLQRKQATLLKEYMQ